MGDTGGAGLGQVEAATERSPERLAIRMNLGPRAQLGDINQRLTDLATLVDLGSRWAVQVERQTGTLPDTAVPYLGMRGLDSSWIYWQLTAERASDALAEPPAVARITYSNPLEVELIGSAVLLSGVVLAARLVRDWSANRRIGAAKADVAESHAVAATGEARIQTARAELYEWLVDQAKTEGDRVPASELLSVTSNFELGTLDRLAEDEIDISAA